MDLLDHAIRSFATIFHTNSGEILAGLGVGNSLGLSEKIEAKRSAEYDGADLITEANGNPLLISTSELPDDTLIVAGVGKADTENSESFRGADSDVFNFQIGRHFVFPSTGLVEEKTSVGRGQ